MATGPLYGQSIAITGELPSLPREEAAVIIEQLGGRFVSSISGKTSILIVGDGAGGKVEKAKALDIPIHDEDWLLALDAKTPSGQKLNLKAAEVAAVMARIASAKRPTWDSRQSLSAEQARGVRDGLARVGVSVCIDGDESSRIVCVLAMSNDIPSALVCCPNGEMFFFAPGEFEMSFWRFALDHYFVVTWNAGDRQVAADLVGVDVAKIGGKSLFRSRDTERSWMPIGDILVDIGCVF